LLDNKKNSRWWNSKNDLSQGSVLAPTMFNIYINDKPISKDQSINHYIYIYIYADNCAIAVQDASFKIVKKKPMTTYTKISTYYHENLRHSG